MRTPKYIGQSPSFVGIAILKGKKRCIFEQLKFDTAMSQIVEYHFLNHVRHTIRVL